MPPDEFIFTSETLVNKKKVQKMKGKRDKARR